jgi:hypothetical protein
MVLVKKTYGDKKTEEIPHGLGEAVYKDSYTYLREEVIRFHGYWANGMWNGQGEQNSGIGNKSQIGHFKNYKKHGIIV